MKKQIVVHIDIDTETGIGPYGNGSHTLYGNPNISPLDPRNEGKDVYVQVRKEKGLALYPLITLAHEMGHVIGFIFKTPKFMKDIKSREASAPTAEMFNDMYKSEVEAWDIAEKALFQKDKEESLATYRDEPKKQFGITVSTE
jgi:hypothetical protein